MVLQTFSLCLSTLCSLILCLWDELCDYTIYQLQWWVNPHYLYISSIFISNFLSGWQIILPTNVTVCCTQMLQATGHLFIYLHKQIKQVQVPCMLVVVWLLVAMTCFLDCWWFIIHVGKFPYNILYFMGQGNNMQCKLFILVWTRNFSYLCMCRILLKYHWCINSLVVISQMRSPDWTHLSIWSLTSSDCT